MGVGVVAVGVGVGQFVDAYKAIFRKDLKRGEMTRPEKEIVDTSAPRAIRRCGPSATVFLRKLAANWRLGIASGSPARLIGAVLSGAWIRDCIELYVSSDEVRAGKPQPDVYLEAARRLDVDPRDCAIVEDSTNGIKAAHAAGAMVIAIPSRPFPPERTTLRLADVVLPDIRQLTPDVVSGLRP